MSCCENECKVKNEAVAPEVEEKVLELSPAADVFENQDGVTVELEVPGANSDTVDVEVKHRVLSITAKSRLSRGGRKIVYKRAFQLSDAIDCENVTASAADGVLTIVLPKSEHARIHKIKVN